MTEVVLPLLPERYVCTRLLGEGATGMVYHAEDRLLETEVAVKVIKSNLAMHRRFRARFAREVALSARITHPHVIPVHDTGTLASGQPYVALGYAAGGSLEEFLELRPPLQDVLALIDEVLDALAAIHARQLLHQAFSPAAAGSARAGAPRRRPAALASHSRGPAQSSAGR